MVTVTFTAPSAPPVEAGTVAFKLVLLTKVTSVPLFAPKATVAPVTKLVPVIVTTAPPAGETTVGEILVMVGAGLACACKSGHNSNIGAIIAVRPAMRKTDLRENEFGVCDFIRFFSTNVLLTNSLQVDLNGFCALGVESKFTAQMPSAGLRRQLIAAVKPSQANVATGVRHFVGAGPPLVLDQIP